MVNFCRSFLRPYGGTRTSAERILNFLLYFLAFYLLYNRKKKLFKLLLHLLLNPVSCGADGLLGNAHDAADVAVLKAHLVEDEEKSVMGGLGLIFLLEAAEGGEGQVSAIKARNQVSEYPPLSKLAGCFLCTTVLAAKIRQKSHFRHFSSFFFHIFGIFLVHIPLPSFDP